MKDFVIIGAGDFADMIWDVISNDMHRNVAGYAVDANYLKEDTCRGLPVAAFEEISEKFPPDRYAAAIGLIGSRMYEQRYEKYLQLKRMGYELENVIHSTASISQTATLGDGNIFLQFTVVGTGSRVGNCNILSPKSYVSHNVQVGDANFFAPSASTTGYVEIGNHCFLGVNSAVNNKAKVADYTFAGGGVFLSGDTKEYEIYLPERSVPMKRIRSIDFQMFTSRRES